MILTEGPGPRSFKETLTDFVKTKWCTRGIQCGTGNSSSAGYFKAWVTSCSRGDQRGSLNSFHTTLIKRLAPAPTQLCQAVLVCNCFHIFFEPLSFIFHHILCLFLLSWTLNLWLLIHVYHSRVPYTDLNKLGAQQRLICYLLMWI